MSIPTRAPAGATQPIRAVWREVAERWGSRVSSSGVSVCRRIAGSTSWSQHAWGNAWDITGPTAVLNAVATFLRSARMREHVAQVLWQVPDHYDHIHVSGRPLFSGTPPCAGGITLEEEHRLIVTRRPLPRAREAVAGESWAPVARSTARHLVRASSKAARYAAAIEQLTREV